MDINVVGCGDTRGTSLTLAVGYGVGGDSMAKGKPCPDPSCPSTSPGPAATPRATPRGDNAVTGT